MSRLENYTFAATDFLLCAGTLGTAVPYAWRHLQHSFATEEGKWRHRLIAILESIPLGIGFLVGVIERIWIHCHPIAPSTPEQTKPLTSARVELLEDPKQSKEILSKQLPPIESLAEPVLPVANEIPGFEPILPITDVTSSDVAELRPEKIPSHASWRKQALTIDECARKALKNLEKARRHHILDDLGQPRRVRNGWTQRETELDSVQIPDYFDVAPLPTTEELRDQKRLAAPLSFSISHDERWSGAGTRESSDPRTSRIEDAHFAKMLKEGCYFGLFDGHGGPAVAQFAASLCMNNIEAFLAATGGNRHQALELLLDWVQEKIRERSLLTAGTTVALGFIDSHTGIATIATLADAEVSLYTMDESGGSAKLLPLSPLLSWKDQKERNRTVANGWISANNRLFGQLAVSRALGDCSFTRAGLSHKPKITQFRVRPGQILLAACDGLREDAYKKLKMPPEQHIAEQITRYQKEGDAQGRSLAKVLVDSAETYSTDDISAMVIKIG